jgi:propane monooxygenase reductase subunit
MVRLFYGARTQRDLFYVDLIMELGSGLPDFEFMPVLSDAAPDDTWESDLPHGLGFVHEVVDKYLESGEMSDPEAYMCGPPPMIDAMSELLVDRHRVPDQQIFHDKFTTSADADVEHVTEEA